MGVLTKTARGLFVLFGTVALSATLYASQDEPTDKAGSEFRTASNNPDFTPLLFPEEDVDTFTKTKPFLRNNVSALAFTLSAKDIILEGCIHSGYFETLRLFSEHHQFF